MARVGIYLDDAIEKRLKDFAYKKTGTFRGQSEIVVKAIIEYLDRHENEVGEKGNASVPAIPKHLPEQQR